MVVREGCSAGGPQPTRRGKRSLSPWAGSLDSPALVPRSWFGPSCREREIRGLGGAEQWWEASPGCWEGF